MATVKVTQQFIVYNRTSGGIRHHQVTSQNHVLASSQESLSTGDISIAMGIPNLFFNGQMVQFAFMSIVGNADSKHLYTKAGNQSFVVGDTDITVSVYYAPPGGIGGVDGGPGIWVDAFNVDLGMFSDVPVFMDVLQPPTPPDAIEPELKAYANQEGVLPTERPHNIRAGESIDGDPQFRFWKNIVVEDEETTGRLIEVREGTSGKIMVAFYESDPVSLLIDLPPMKAPRGKFIEIYPGHWIELPFPVWGGSPTPGGRGPRPNEAVSLILKRSLALAAMVSAAEDLSPSVGRESVTLVSKQLRLLADEVREVAKTRYGRKA